MSLSFSASIRKGSTSFGERLAVASDKSYRQAVLRLPLQVWPRFEEDFCGLAAGCGTGSRPLEKGPGFALELGQLLDVGGGELVATHLEPAPGAVEAILRLAGIAEAVMAHRQEKEVEAIGRALTLLKALFQYGHGLGKLVIAVQGDAQRVVADGLLRRQFDGLASQW